MVTLRTSSSVDARLSGFTVLFALPEDCKVCSSYIFPCSLCRRKFINRVNSFTFRSVYFGIAG